MDKVERPMPVHTDSLVWGDDGMGGYWGGWGGGVG